MDKFVGKRLDGRYEIQEIIGVGGMAVVYKAHDNQENRTVAIKILKEEFISNEEFIRRFKNESKAIAMLSHPNIVKVYDVSFGDLIQYIVMEYIEGITLKEFIETEGSLRWKDAVHFTIQILKGLQHAHDKGIVHRDVKPQNIMVLADGTIKVTDFGIARFSRSDQRTITDKAIGSVHYISPEQARGEKTDEKADIYSVGVMLYEMLTGKLPFQAESAVSVAIMQLQRDPQLPTEINGSIPLGLEQITMHAMQKTPERRYQSAAEMLCDLGLFRKDPSLTFEHNYFVDNSPTKFVGAIGNDENTAAPIIEDEEIKEKNNMIPILAGIAVALVIAIIVLAAIFLPGLFGDTGEEVKCPDFVGMNYEDIEANKQYQEDFDFELKWETNNEYDFGMVFEQSKEAGEPLKGSKNITLYVSMGKSTKKVPDVYGKNESAAVSELKSQGFTTVTTEEPSEDVDAGLVIRTDPQRTEVVPEGAKITVYISSGKATKNVKAPDVVGMTEDAAKKQLEEKGLKAEIEEIYITNKDKYYPIGYVVKQSPESSSEEIPEGSNVKLSVCKGYKYDIKVDMPTDLAKGLYKITLWENGKQIDNGDTIDTAQMKSYVFDGIVSKEDILTVVVKIEYTDSSNKKKNVNLYDNITMSIKNKEPVDSDFSDVYPVEGEQTQEGTQGTTGGTGSSQGSKPTDSN